MATHQQQQQSANSGSAGAWGTPSQSQQSNTLGWGAATGGGGGGNGGRGGSGSNDNGNLGPVPSQVRGSDNFGPPRNSPSGPQGVSSNGSQGNSAWGNANSNQSSTGWGSGPTTAPAPPAASAWGGAAPQASSDDAGRAAAWNQPQFKSSGPPASSFPDRGDGIQPRASGYRAQPPHMQQGYGGDYGGGPSRQQGGQSRFFGQAEGDSGDNWATGERSQGNYGGQQRQRAGPPPSFASQSRQGEEFGGGNGGAIGAGSELYCVAYLKSACSCADPKSPLLSQAGDPEEVGTPGTAGKVGIARYRSASENAERTIASRRGFRRARRRRGARTTPLCASSYGWSSEIRRTRVWRLRQRREWRRTCELPRHASPIVR